MKTTLSNRALHFPENVIRGLTSLAVQAEQKGVSVIPLNIGAPDVKTPKEILSGGVSFLKKTKAIRYGASVGQNELIQTLQQFYTKRLGFTDITLSSLMITQGASEALELVLYTIADSGDKILVPDPCYSNYYSIAYKYGVTLVPIATVLENGFHIIRNGESDEQAYVRLCKLIKPKTKAILWSSPANPTGSVYSLRELRLLLRIAKKYNLWLVADEVYRLLTFSDSSNKGIVQRAHSILDVAIGDDRKRIIVLDSTSKMLSFCGARIGIVTADPPCISSMVQHASVRGCPSTIGQAAASNLSQVSLKYFLASNREFKLRRDTLHKGLSELKELGVSVSQCPPEGAFYIVTDLGKNIIASDFCKWLLTDYIKDSSKKETVFLTPMRIGKSGFYLSSNKGMSEVRLAYVLDRSLLRRAIEVLKDALVTYRKLQNIA